MLFLERVLEVFEEILIPILKINIGEMRMKLPKSVILNPYNNAMELEAIMYDFLNLICYWKLSGSESRICQCQSVVFIGPGPQVC